MKTIAGVNPLINGFEYGWSNIGVFINGILPTLGITAIDYSQTAVLENLYGYGNMPLARGAGNYSAEASITLYKSEIIALETAARQQNPLNSLGEISQILPFDITVSFLRPDGSGVSTNILRNCQFTDNKVSSKQGDTSITTQLTLVLSHIEWNA